MHRGGHGDDVSGMASFRVQHRELPLCCRFVSASGYECSSHRPRVELDVELKTLADQMDQAGSGCVSSKTGISIAEARNCHNGNSEKVVGCIL